MARVRTELAQVRAIRRIRTERLGIRALRTGGRLTDIRETAVRCRRVQAASIRRIRVIRRGRAIPASREGTRRARTHPRTAG